MFLRSRSLLLIFSSFFLCQFMSSFSSYKASYQPWILTWIFEYLIRIRWAQKWRSVCVAMGDEQNSVDKYILSIDSEMETSASGFMPISKINKKKVPKDLGSFIVSLQQCNQAQEDTINPYFIRTEWKSFRSYKAQPLAPPVLQTLVEPISQRFRPRRPGIRAGPDHKSENQYTNPHWSPS